MKYYSTRDKGVSLSAAEAVKMGLSRDGGLLPEEIPQIRPAFSGKPDPHGVCPAGGPGSWLVVLTDYTEEELLTFGHRALRTGEV